MGKPDVALIAGPTASGKSGLAVELALALEKQGKRGVIINADSAQVYADLHVLSARPNDAEMAGVEHRLFGKWDGMQPCSAADWAERAKQEIARAQGDDAVPILVGGTGMYMQVLLDGIAPIPAIDPKVRGEVRAMETATAHALLQAEDPVRADQLSPGDTQRISRALEVLRSTGRPLSYWQERNEGGISDAIILHPLVLLPAREWLYDRCDRRFIEMLELGAMEEVEALIARQLDPDLPIMRAIGVKEIAAYLNGESSREEMIDAGAQATRNYAKRQYTWFRNQPPEEWVRIESQNYDFNALFALLLHH